MSEPKTPILDDNKLVAERSEKLAAIGSRGVAFPNDFKPTHHAADLHLKHGNTPNEEPEPKAVEMALAGRIVLVRVTGRMLAWSL